MLSRVIAVVLGIVCVAAGLFYKGPYFALGQSRLPDARPINATLGRMIAVLIGLFMLYAGIFQSWK